MKKEILVIDDELFVLKLFERAFSTAGYSVTTASGGEEALRLARTRSFPAIFLDLKMPGMNGVELCREIRKIHPRACIFAVTAYASAFELSEFEKAGIDDYFTKPVDLDQLFAAAEAAFEKWDNGGR